MRCCIQGPLAAVRRIGFNGLEMAVDIQTPSDGPTFEFWSEFRPLFFHPRHVSTLVVKQQGSGLDEPLHQQNFFKV